MLVSSKRKEVVGRRLELVHGEPILVKPVVVLDATKEFHLPP